MTVVVQRSPSGWVVLRCGVVHSSHSTKQDARDEGRRIAKKFGDELHIQRVDGSLQTRTDYGVAV